MGFLRAEDRQKKQKILSDNNGKYQTKERKKRLTQINNISYSNYKNLR